MSLHPLRLLSVCLTALLLSAMSVHAQNNAPPPLVVSLPQGGFVAFRIKTVPLNVNASTGAEDESAAPRLSLSPQVLVDEGNVVHRLLADEKGRLVFGYDLVVELLPADKKFKVIARPLDRQFEARLQVRGSASAPRDSTAPFNVSTLARQTDEQLVADGETFALDLLVNEQLGLKVVDYVKTATEKSLLLAPNAPPSRPARDFTVTNVELAIKDYQLHRDGEALHTTGARRSCAGALLWLALPEGGRFIFSLAPHEGYDFRKTGTIEDDTIAFNWKGVRYEWISTEPIVGGGGTWNLWVLHDPHYVDVFAPPVIKTPEESKLARLLRDPLGVIAEQSDKTGRTSLQTKGKRTAPAAGRVRVRIGAADTIEALLPKN
ncbi:MAG: hypothetical protein H0T45_07345 [Pyrinomonadaceae bacterium]|nr:hypothetical protein [Pyrinomonadaceae bacterium]